MDEAVIEAAKKYAEEKGKSLSSILENMLRTTIGLKQKKSLQEDKISDTPLVDELVGIIKKGKNSKEEIEAYEKELYQRKPYMKDRMEYYNKKHGWE